MEHDPTRPRGGTKPKGARSFKTLKRRALDRQAAESGITPLEYMLKVLRAPDPVAEPGESMDTFMNRVMSDAQIKLAAARFAAPYIHARIATEVRVKNDTPRDGPVDVLELAKSVAFLLTVAERKKPITINQEQRQLQ